MTKDTVISKEKVEKISTFGVLAFHPTQWGGNLIDAKGIVYAEITHVTDAAAGMPKGWYLNEGNVTNAVCVDAPFVNVPFVSLAELMNFFYPKFGTYFVKLGQNLMAQAIDEMSVIEFDSFRESVKSIMAEV